MTMSSQSCNNAFSRLSMFLLFFIKMAFDDGVHAAALSRTFIGEYYLADTTAASTNTNGEIKVLDGIALDGNTSYGNGGYSVSFVGDFNGDGHDDMLISALEAIPPPSPSFTSAGICYLIYGGSNLTSTTVLASLDKLDGKTGFAMYGLASNAFTGSSVSGAGDVNGIYLVFISISI
jgi:hypothetical protein